jgi:HAD superfamily hydrolase (TIGR01509 family)
MPSAEVLDAVTVDAAGTCLELVNPVDRLRRALGRMEVARSREAVADAFAAEVDYYVPRSHLGRDAETLAELRRSAVAVFLGALGSPLPAESFVDEFVGAIEFLPAPGAVEALEALRAAGLELACIANWDASLGHHLAHAGVEHLFRVVVTSAEAGAPKPAPDPFLLALERLGIGPDRALHIGDSEADRDGARAAGLAFEPPPLATLPRRLGLGARP